MKLNLSRFLFLYLGLTGFFGHFIFIFLLVYLEQTEGLMPRQVFVKALEHYNIQSPIVSNLLKPDQKFVNLPLDGEVKLTHPRIVLPELANGSSESIHPVIKDRISKYQAQKYVYYSPMCGKSDMLPMVVCWLTNKDPDVLVKIISAMRRFSLNKPSADTVYSNGWELALAYDLTYSALNASDRRDIEKKLVIALNDTLSNLDEDFAALWHGRATHAAIAWICAVVLSDQYVDNLSLLRQRAQGHFLTVLNGLAYTEIWPDGYNYWIQNRAFLFALAASAYINGLEYASHKDHIINIMRRVGYWHIYATRPDNRVEGFGDEGSRVDLKEETQRVIDLIAQMTRDPLLAGYSKYLSYLHKADGYYRHYTWGILLFKDPSIPALGNGSLVSLEPFLKKAEIFGKNATNYVYLRSGWGADDTFISFKAGHSFSHHAHYDAGHFTIFKGSPLATNSSTYKGFFSDHRLNYAIRTIAKNSLLILKPHEKVRPNRHFKNNVADGGQRLTLPTGSAITSMDDWLKNYKQGKHLEGAELLHFSAKENEFYYIDTDLTPSYNNTVFDENGVGGKVKDVRRQLLYLPAEDQLLIYDQVVSTQDSYIKKWLLHTVNEISVANPTVLKGSMHNGILQSSADHAVIKNGRGFLKVKRFLPENAVIRLVGGKDYQYYVEDDADETLLDGKNYNQDASDASWFDVSMWRMEIQAQVPAQKTEFLIALSPSINDAPTDEITAIKIKGDVAYGLRSKESIVLFVKAQGPQPITLNIEEPIRRIIVVGASANALLITDKGEHLIGQAEDGVILFGLDKSTIQGQVEIKLS